MRAPIDRMLRPPPEQLLSILEEVKRATEPITTALEQLGLSLRSSSPLRSPSHAQCPWNYSFVTWRGAEDQAAGGGGRQCVLFERSWAKCPIARRRRCCPKSFIADALHLNACIGCRVLLS